MLLSKLSCYQIFKLFSLFIIVYQIFILFTASVLFTTRTQKTARQPDCNCGCGFGSSFYQQCKISRKGILQSFARFFVIIGRKVCFIVHVIITVRFFFFEIRPNWTIGRPRKKNVSRYPFFVCVGSSRQFYRMSSFSIFATLPACMELSHVISIRIIAFF